MNNKTSSYIIQFNNPSWCEPKSHFVSHFGSYATLREAKKQMAEEAKVYPYLRLRIVKKTVTYKTVVTLEPTEKTRDEKKNKKPAKLVDLG